MAEVTVRAAELHQTPMPPLCARTGQPTTNLVRVRVVHTPWWAWFGILGGIVVVAILTMTERTIELRVPHATRRVLRRRLAITGLAVLSLPLTTCVVAAVLAPGLVSFSALAAGLALTAGCVRVHLGAYVRGRWVDEHTVRLRGLDPSFAAAYQQALDQRREAERRAVLAGWHPDPAGEHALRWFDGTAWTAYVHPAPQAAY